MDAVPVYLVFVGHHSVVLLGDLVARLNGLQSAFEFRLLPGADISGTVVDFSLEDVQACDTPPFYTDGSILGTLETVLERYPEVERNAHVAVVTNVRITRGRDCSPEPGEAGDYFGLWWPAGVDETRRRAAISLALYLDRYQDRGRRTAEQYVAFLLVAFLGDTLFEPKLTHLDFRFCVFDYNDDLDSIVPSIRRSGLCEKCQERIASSVTNTAERVSGKSLLQAFNSLLRYVHRPHPRVVFETLQHDALFSLIVLGVAAGVVINLISNLLGFGGLSQLGIVLALLLLGLAWIVKQHYRPGPLFR